MSYEFNGMDVIPSEAQGVVSAVAGVLIVAAIVIVLLAIVLYVIKSLGLYTIAKRRGIGCAWLAWLPVGCEWITGSIADQYRKVTRGKATIRRFIIVAVAIAGIALSAFTTSGLNENLAELQELAEYAESFDQYMYEEDVMYIFEQLGELLSGFALYAALSAVLSFISKVYWHVCAGDVFASCCPNNATMMLVLSICLPVLEPFFFFCNKEKDAGMIPAGQPQAVEPQVPVTPAQTVAAAPAAPVQTVWEAPVEPAQPVFEASAEPAQQPAWEATQPAAEPWAAADVRPEPWENPEN